MRVLVACEYTGIIRAAFESRGHDAWSCDIKDTLIPGKHIKDDVRNHLVGWDLIIAHPPCTHLAVSGARWFKDKQIEQALAAEFFMQLYEAPCDKICVENPVSVMSRLFRKPDQIIQPWQFGDSFQKTTCLWLKGLPKLTPTNIVSRGEFVIHGGRKISKWYSNNKSKRDMTFPGIAHAMASQWG